jgi:hypothetical protein
MLLVSMRRATERHHGLNIRRRWLTQACPWWTRPQRHRRSALPRPPTHYRDKYQVGLDPAALTLAERRDPWLRTIPCRFGTIYPFGEGLLAVDVEHHPKKASQLAGIPGVRLHQDGDGEKTFLFPVDLFEKVARVVRPRRKYQSSPCQLANLMAGTP